MKTPKLHPTHQAASRRAAEDALFPLPDDHPFDEALEAGGRYQLGDERYDLWYALGFLIASDHVLADNELADIIMHLRAIPEAWRTVICRGGPDPADRGLAIASRIATGKFEASIELGYPKQGDPLLRMVARAGARLNNRVGVYVDSDDLIVEIKSCTIRSPLVVQWWAADDMDDHAGEAQMVDGLRLGSRCAVLPGLASKRVFCVIADGSPAAPEK